MELRIIVFHTSLYYLEFVPVVQKKTFDPVKNINDYLYCNTERVRHGCHLSITDMSRVFELNFKVLERES